MKIRIKITTSENLACYGVSSGTEIEEDFEKYVAAVVASEIGNASTEACKAQAVVSRTFAYRYILKNKPIPDSSSAQSFRIKRYSDSYKICIEAAKQTAGLVLFYKGTPIDAYFSNSNGGMVVSSQERWGGARDYLISKPDPWDAATHVTKSGHGVGMSQVGAKYAAQHGVSFEDILDFYYPGTSLKPIPDEEKEEVHGMISLSKFLNGCKRNAARIKDYELGCTGANGKSDCIGYVMGALALEGQKWGGTHGSNYAARYRMRTLRKVTNASQLKLGELVYKHNVPGTKAWKESFPINKYKDHPDQNDYYHVGVVTSVNPLEISHCSGGGMHYDKKLGYWDYAGECSLVDYGTTPSVDPIEDDTTVVKGPCKAIVDVPNDTTVNIRSAMSTASKVLVKANEGTELDVLSVSGTWAKVNYGFDKTGTGYVMSQFIRDNVVDVPNDTTVNVRIQPSKNSSKITTLREGTSVRILARLDGWYQIKYTEPKTGTGYVMTKYLRKKG